MWQTMLLPTLTSVTGSWLIILAFWFYNRKKQSDARDNEYARLVNEIGNLNDKFGNLNDKFDNLNTRIDNESEARNNQYTRLENQIANLNEKFDNGTEKFNNGFERFFIEIDKLRTDVEANTKKIDFLTSAVNNNIKNTQDLTHVVVELQSIVHESIK